MLAHSGPPKSNTPEWALPSARVAPPQTSLTSLEYTLRGTIGLSDDDVSYREQLYTSEFSAEATSYVCISYMYLSRGVRWFKGSQQVGFFPVSNLPKLSTTDRSTVDYAVQRLNAKSLYSSVIQFLLPSVFDLVQLQEVFETVTSQSVDRRNFRKKINQLKVIEPLEKTSRKKSSNEPDSYRFSRLNTLTVYQRPFLSRASQSV